MLPKGFCLILLGGIIIVLRTYFNIYFISTGVQIVSEATMVIGFFLQIILLIAGFTIWQLSRSKQKFQLSY